jgi:hypothetical protein
MCNNETDWPVLPDLPAVERESLAPGPEHSGHIIRLLLAVVCPIAILGGSLTGYFRGTVFGIKKQFSQ